MARHESAILSVGDRAPHFTLPNHRGEPRSLADALARGPVLLGFHRGTW
jgi:peroxiredoxin